MNLKNPEDRINQSPFECGFETCHIYRAPFSIHFFIVALIFILFDVELIILFPLITELLSV